MDKTWRKSAGKKQLLALSYLSGVYMGDGCISKARYKVKGKDYSYWRFTLSAIDLDFIEASAKAFKDAFDRDAKIYGPYTDKRFSKSKPSWRIHVHGEELLGLKEDTQDRNRLPKFIKYGDDDEKREFVAGIMDSEGYCAKTKWRTKRNGHDWSGHRYLLGVAACDPWIDEFASFLQSLGIKTYKRHVWKPKQDGRKTKITYHMNKESFLNSGCYFKIARKNERLLDYARRSGLFPSEAIRQTQKCKDMVQPHGDVQGNRVDRLISDRNSELKYRGK